MPQYSRGHRVRSNPGPSLPQALAAVPQVVKVAAVESEKALSKAKVRHLFVGGIAVAAYGYERSTKDVDFLVGDEAFHTKGKIVFPRSDIPLAVGGVIIDLVTLPQAQVLVEHELNTNQGKVVSLPFLVFMKLLAYRPRDREDIVQLLMLDADRRDNVRSALTPLLTSQPELTRRLDGCIREATNRTE